MNNMKFHVKFTERAMKYISFLNTILLIVGTLILHYSEIYRGQNPLYVSLKILGWALFIGSIVWSLTNTLLIYFYEEYWRHKIIWIIISIIPCVYLFSLLFLGFYIKI